MTLPKKHSRSIAVDSIRYRYSVSRSGANDVGVFPLNLTVQIESGHGCILKVNGMFTRDYWLDVPEPAPLDNYFTLQPGQVATIIRHALRCGWPPAVTGKPFLITINSSELQNAR